MSCKYCINVHINLDKQESKPSAAGAADGDGFTEMMNGAVQDCAANGSNVMADKLNRLTEEAEQLKEKIASLEELLKKEKLIDRIRDNDKMIKFYTDLKTWRLFQNLYKLIWPGIENFTGSNQRSLCKEEQFMLILMRIGRLNLSEQDLAYRFRFGAYMWQQAVQIGIFITLFRINFDSPSHFW